MEPHGVEEVPDAAVAEPGSPVSWVPSLDFCPPNGP